MRSFVLFLALTAQLAFADGNLASITPGSTFTTSRDMLIDIRDSHVLLFKSNCKLQIDESVNKSSSVTLPKGSKLVVKKLRTGMASFETEDGDKYYTDYLHIDYTSKKFVSLECWWVNGYDDFDAYAEDFDKFAAELSQDFSIQLKGIPVVQP